jgi:hypothetical protein
MGAFFVSTQRDSRKASVEASNWLVALGMGLDQMGIVTSIDRLACEVLPNGKVIARDVRTGTSFIVQAATPAARPERSESEPEAAEELLSMGEDDDLDDSPDGAWDPEEPFLATPDALPGVEITESDEDWSYSYGADQSPTEEVLTDRALRDILTRIAACKTEENAWKEALAGARELIPCESGAALRQEWDGNLRFIAALGPLAHQVIGEQVPAGLGIVGFSVQRRVSLLIREPRKDPRFFASIDRRTGYRTASVLAVPVVYDSTTFGCLELLNAPRGFSQENLNRLFTIAEGLGEQMVIAV